jgi:vacuolar-type H+-ATPase subunit E/Vma4
MSAEKIIQQIKKDSDKEIKTILKKAETQAKEIIDSAIIEAEIEGKKIVSNGNIQSENIKRVLVSKANQDYKKEIMIAKEKIIDECFTKAHHKLSILKGQEYEKIVRKLIKNGYNKLGSKCSALISRDIDEKIAKEYNVSVSGKVESSGGVILKSGDERVILNHTFDGILKREKDRIRIKVGKILFL